MSMNEERKEIAIVLARKDGHQLEDFVDWRKTIYAQRADELLGRTAIGISEQYFGYCCRGVKREGRCH